MQLSVQHVNKSFDNTAALCDVCFDVKEGEFVSIIGPSGAGKTTLFRILNGIQSADSGEILISGQNFSAAKGAQKRKIQKHIGTVYQDFCLVEPASCLQNVLNACLPDMRLIPAIFGFFGKTRIDKAIALLERMGIADKAHEPVKNLSGGQKQRVAIARALMRRPDILLADEPVASLDPVTGRQIIELLAELNRNEGITILMNSHNLALSQEFSTRLIGLHDGTVVFDGAPEDADSVSIANIYGSSEDIT